MNREGDFIQLPYSTRNPIEFSIPSLFYTDGGLLDVPEENSAARADRGPLNNLMNIWATDWIHQSMYEEGKGHSIVLSLLCTDKFIEQSSYGFLRFLDMSPSEAHTLHLTPLLRRQLYGLNERNERSQLEPYSLSVCFLLFPVFGLLITVVGTLLSCPIPLGGHTGYLSLISNISKLLTPCQSLTPFLSLRGPILAYLVKASGGLCHQWSLHRSRYIVQIVHLWNVKRMLWTRLPNHWHFTVYHPISKSQKLHTPNSSVKFQLFPLRDSSIHLLSINFRCQRCRFLKPSVSYTILPSSLVWMPCYRNSKREIIVFLFISR